MGEGVNVKEVGVKVGSPDLNLYQLIVPTGGVGLGGNEEDGKGFTDTNTDRYTCQVAC